MRNKIAPNADIMRNTDLVSKFPHLVSDVSEILTIFNFRILHQEKIFQTMKFTCFLYCFLFLFSQKCFSIIINTSQKTSRHPLGQEAHSLAGFLVSKFPH